MIFSGAPHPTSTRYSKAQAGRSAGRAAEQVPAGDQSENCASPRPDDPPFDPRRRRRGHRVKGAPPSRRFVVTVAGSLLLSHIAVNQHRHVTPPGHHIKPLRDRAKEANRRGPVRRRSGPHLRGRSVGIVKELGRITGGVTCRCIFTPRIASSALSPNPA